MTNGTRVLTGPAPTDWTIELPGRPITLNDVYGKHWRTRAAAVAEARKSAGILWRVARIPLPLPGPIAVDVTAHYPTARSLPDTGACVPSAKAAIDGLIDCRALSDDGPTHVVRVSYHAPQVMAGPAGLYLTVHLETP